MGSGHVGHDGQSVVRREDDLRCTAGDWEAAVGCWLPRTNPKKPRTGSTIMRVYTADTIVAGETACAAHFLCPKKT